MLCWRRARQFRGLTCRVAGWVDNQRQVLQGTGGTANAVLDPSTGETLGEVCDADASAVDLCMRSSTKAFGAWQHTSAKQRTEIFRKFCHILEKNQNKLAASISKENGKTVADAKAEVSRGIEALQFAISRVSVTSGSFMDQISEGVNVSTCRVPLGTCLGITPFNFPAMIGLWMFPMAILCGNCFVWKPSELTPLSSLLMGEWLGVDAGLPAGVLNILQGSRHTSEMLIGHPDIHAVSFVGSTQVGSEVWKRATNSGKRAQVNMGAKNHAVVMGDANLDEAAHRLINASFGAAGQRCMAVSVVVTVGREANEVSSKLVEHALKLKVGSPFDADSDVGPLINQKSKAKCLEAINEAEKRGAKVLLDGRQVGQELGGNFLGPTILADVKPNMLAYREELFGPVLCLMNVDTLDEGVQLINSNPHGNGTAIMTSSAACARKFSRQVQVGQVGVNVCIPVPPECLSFTGWRGSFVGDLPFLGQSSIDFYTKTRTIVSRWDTNSQTSGAAFNPST